MEPFKIVPGFFNRAPAPALQPPAWLLGPGVRPPHEAAVARTGGEASGRERATPRPQQPSVSREHQGKWRGEGAEKSSSHATLPSVQPIHTFREFCFVCIKL